MAWHGRHVTVWLVKEELGMVRQVWPVVDGFGGARYGRRGLERRGMAKHGEARQAFMFKHKGETMNEERKLLEKMARCNGGVLMIDDVIKEAQDESSILHSHFEWDDSEAAVQYRREQARTLIQRCRITVLADEPTHVRAFVSLPSDREAGGGYRMVADVMTNVSMKEEFVHDLQLTIARWTKKLHLVDSDISDLIIQLDESLKQLSKNTEVNIERMQA